MMLETLGIVAMLLILGAYATSSSGHLSTRSAVYQGLNLSGSLMFVVYLSVKQAWPSVVLNAVWALIALVVLLRRAKTQQVEKHNAA